MPDAIGSGVSTLVTVSGDPGSAKRIVNAAITEAAVAAAAIRLGILRVAASGSMMGTSLVLAEEHEAGADRVHTQRGR